MGGRGEEERATGKDRNRCQIIKLYTTSEIRKGLRPQVESKRDSLTVKVKKSRKKRAHIKV